MFTLIVFPDGRLLLTTDRQLSADMAAGVMEQFERWRQTDAGVAIISDCRVQHASAVEVDLKVSV